jgi:hypothetical protein
MATRRQALVIVGVLLLFFGTGFALQGANVIGGSAVMSGNSTYIYVGGVLAVIGLILIMVGAMSRPEESSTSTGEVTVPPAAVGSSV